MKLILLSVLFLIVIPGHAQFNYGFQTQLNSLANSGHVTADSVDVSIPDNKIVLTDKTPQTIGIFLEWKLYKRFIVRSELNYRAGQNGGLGVLIQGQKASIVTIVPRNFVIDIPLTFNYNIIQKEWFPFMRIKNFEVGILGGVDILLQKGSDSNTEITFGASPIYKGVNDVAKELYNTQKTTNYFISYGLRIRLSRFVVTYRNDGQIINSGNSDLKVWGNTYPFITKWKYSSISVGYMLHWFDKKYR
jgi:hypothetical protein